ncbi:MAG: hypothetical protein JXR43_07865 [Burkholderiaceae bacterium]|nr:hypothetical protein [Burkholderiaceae bacterium]
MASVPVALKNSSTAGVTKTGLLGPTGSATQRHRFSWDKPVGPFLTVERSVNRISSVAMMVGSVSGDGRERNACGGRISISGWLGQLTCGGSVVQAHKEVSGGNWTPSTVAVKVTVV